MRDTIDSLDINVKAAASVLACAVGCMWVAWTWASEEHRDLETLAREASKLATETKHQTDLLREIVLQQQEAVNRAANDARANREVLIRIEAELRKESSLNYTHRNDAESDG